jgi:hypothetical protein
MAQPIGLRLFTQKARMVPMFGKRAPQLLADTWLHKSTPLACRSAVRWLDAGVAARYGLVREADLALVPATHDDGGIVEIEAAAQARSGRVDVDKASAAFGALRRPPRGHLPGT